MARPTSESQPGMWRYRDLLPAVEPVTLGEGWTSLLPSRQYPGLLIKDESRNPTGSVYARGVSVAVSLARQQGLKEIACIGPAAATFAAYAQAAGMTAHVHLPREDFIQGLLAKAYGAEIHFSDAVADLLIPAEAGTKTLAYELCEQLDWHAPDAILAPPALLPTLAAAFKDLYRAGWLAPGNPPIFHPSDATEPTHFSHEGLLLSHAGAAALATYEHLLATGTLPPAHRAVAINPTSALLALEDLARNLNFRRPTKLPHSMPVGGIITPV